MCMHHALRVFAQPAISINKLPLVWFGVMMTLVATKKAPFSAGGITY